MTIPLVNEPTVNEESQPLLNNEKPCALVDEFKTIIYNALPLTVTFFLQGTTLSMPLFFVGRLGAVQLGGVAIANVTFVVSLAIFIGLSTSLDTLCPQAYGAKQYRLVGLYFQRCVVLASIVSIPIIILWCYSSKLLEYFVEDPEVIEIAAKYLQLMTVSLPGFVVFECGKRYFQSQSNFTKGQSILFFCAPMNALLSYLLVLRFEYGYVGACYSLIFTYNLMGLMMSVSIYCCHRKAQICNPSMDCWHEFSLKAFRNLGPLLRLSIPGIIMVEAEFFAFEVLSILAARFGTTALAAQSIASAIESFSFQIPFSVGVAASNRIAFHIGQNNIQNCETATRCTLLYIGSLLSLINFIILTLGRYQICKLFTNEPAVIVSAAHLVAIVGVNQFWDVFNILGAACLRAQGRQKIGGYLSLFAYYIVGLPMAVLLGFKFELEARGLWMGLGVGIFILSISELYCVYSSNWRKIMKGASKLHHV